MSLLPSSETIDIVRGTGRAIIGIFYLAMAAGLVKDFANVTALMREKGVPAAAALLPLTIAIWIIGGGALLFGYGTADAALLLIGPTLICTPVMHDFWRAPDAQAQANDLQHFFKNFAIVGALILLIAS